MTEQTDPHWLLFTPAGVFITTLMSSKKFKDYLMSGTDFHTRLDSAKARQANVYDIRIRADQVVGYKKLGQ